jgi:hypothetical protein
MRSYKSPDTDGIFLQTGASLNFGLVLPQEQRSVSFSTTRNDVLAIEGVMGEVNGRSTDTFVFLGGLEGVKAKEGTGDAIRPIFKGDDLVDAASPFHDLTFSFVQADNVSSGGDRLAGSVSVSFIVS